MSARTATVTRLAERIRSLTPALKIDAIARDVDDIAHDVDGLRVLASAGVEAQRATGDALALMADRLGSMDARLEAVESGVLESNDIARQGLDLARSAETRARDAMESDVDLAQTVELQRAAWEAEAQRTREALAPILADVSRRAGNAGAAKTAGVLSIGALVTGLAAQPVETIKLIREIGPSGAGIAVVLLLVALVWARRRRS